LNNKIITHYHYYAGLPFYRGILDPVSPFKLFTTKTILGRLLFDVCQPVKDGMGDLQVAVIY
jgi:hypothetical protein